LTDGVVAGRRKNNRRSFDYGFSLARKTFAQDDIWFFDRLCASTCMSANPLTIEKKNSPRRVLLASLVGTTIEFFDFYIYDAAAVLVFPALFFLSRIRCRLGKIRDWEWGS
jgi:hypothetical protein